ncbi:unnamed protein product [Sphagnum troendelagicum]
MHVDTKCQAADPIALLQLSMRRLNAITRAADFVHAGYKKLHMIDGDDAFSYVDVEDGVEICLDMASVLSKYSRSVRYIISMYDGGIYVILIRLRSAKNEMHRQYVQWRIKRDYAMKQRNKVEDLSRCDYIIGNVSRVSDYHMLVPFLQFGGRDLSKVFGFRWGMNGNDIKKGCVVIKEYFEEHLMSSIFCPSIDQAVEYYYERMHKFEDPSYDISIFQASEKMMTVANEAEQENKEFMLNFDEIQRTRL